MTDLPWVEKYRPSCLDDVFGNRNSLSLLKKWGFDWGKDKKACILYGVAGTGKTSSAIALANDMNWNTLEVNASDVRSKKAIEKFVEPNTISKGFNDIKTLVIIDEADNLHGNTDRGGIKSITDLVKETKQPIIIIVNDFYKLPYELKNICLCLEFVKIDLNSIIIVLNKICESEGISSSRVIISKIAKNSDGDLRSAINELQSNFGSCIGGEDSELILHDNYLLDNVFTTLNGIVNSPNIAETNKLMMNSEKNPEELIQWIDQNLSSMFNNKETLFEAYDSLSHADLFISRTHRRQYYKLWKYASLTMGCGSNVISNYLGSLRGFVKYQSPSGWGLMSKSKKNRMIMKSCILKLAKGIHVSEDFVNSDLLEFFKYVMISRSVDMSADFNFSEDEISFMLDGKLDKKSVKMIYNSAQERIKIREAENLSVETGISFNIKDILDTSVTSKQKKQEKLTKGQFTFDGF